jgi:hypothetical protein
VHIRRLAPHEADLHRVIRLSALRGAPDSFGETLTDTLARPQSYWDELTRHVTGAGGQIMVLACDGQQVIGSAYGLFDHERRDLGRVGGMWVDPPGAAAVWGPRSSRRSSPGRASAASLASGSGPRLIATPRSPSTPGPAFARRASGARTRAMRRGRSSRWSSSWGIP